MAKTNQIKQKKEIDNFPISKIDLNEREQDEIRGIDRAISILKTELADYYLLICQTQPKIFEMQAILSKRVHEIALMHGVDLNQQSSGKWDLNVQTMVFNRIE